MSTNQVAINYTLPTELQDTDFNTLRMVSYHMTATLELTNHVCHGGGCKT